MQQTALLALVVGISRTDIGICITDLVALLMTRERELYPTETCFCCSISAFDIVLTAHCSITCTRVNWGSITDTG
jgi:hypothetical protein